MLTKEVDKKGYKRKVLKIAVAETIYAIWNERNEKIFNHREIDRKIVEKIIQIIRLRCNMNSKLKIHVMRYT